jgi:hypothetical protein
VVLTQREQEYRSDENRKLRTVQGIPDGELYHYDTPFTIDNLIRLFLRAGFAKAEAVWSRSSTAIVAAEKWVVPQGSRPA